MGDLTVSETEIAVIAAQLSSLGRSVDGVRGDVAELRDELRATAVRRDVLTPTLEVLTTQVQASAAVARQARAMAMTCLGLLVTILGLGILSAVGVA